MTSLLCTKTNRNVSLVKEIANSGEGKVWKTDRDGYLAKVYHDPTPERIEKLEVMIAHPPHQTQQGHISFAWATSVLKDAQGKSVGFLMPEIKEGRELIEVYSPRRRKQKGLEVDWRFLHATAYNTAVFVRDIHQAGYVIGDIKPQNILVNSRAMPSIIDTDSFQVRNPKTGKIYRCLVGSDGFTPRELLGKNLEDTDQTEVHDRFRLAVIIFLLLFGDEPFKGKWMGAGDSPDPVELLKRGWWAYGIDSLIEPSPTTIPLEVVHPEIKKLFIKCFNHGHQNPSLRPTAEEWKIGLASALQDLTVCGKVDTHFFHRGNGSCYWCDRHKKLGLDIFEFKRTVISTSTVSNSRNKVSNNIDIYPSEEILELVAQEGRNIRVIGKIDNTPTVRGKLYINFEIDFKKQVGGYNPFYAVIFSQTLQQLAQSTVISKLQNSQGQYAEISGILRIYDRGNRKSPQIIINDPNQIELLTQIEAINLLNTRKTASGLNAINQQVKIQSINKNPHPPQQISVNNNVNNPLPSPQRTLSNTVSASTTNILPNVIKNVFFVDDTLGIVAQEGRSIAVIGKIDRVIRVDGKLRIIFDKDYNKAISGFCPFYVVIYNELHWSILNNPIGNFVKVSGLLKIYNDGSSKSPRIVVIDIDQIVLLSQSEAINLFNTGNNTLTQNTTNQQVKVQSININPNQVQQTSVNINPQQNFVFNHLLFTPKTIFSNHNSFIKVRILITFFIKDVTFALFVCCFLGSILWIILLFLSTPFTILFFGNTSVSAFWGCIVISIITAIIFGCIYLWYFLRSIHKFYLRVKYLLGDYTAFKDKTPSDIQTYEFLYGWDSQIYAVVKYLTKDYQRALLWLDCIIKHNQTDQFIYYNRGITNLALGNYQNAITDFLIAIKSNRQDADSYYGIAYAYLGLGDQQKSDDNFKIAKLLGRK